MSYVCLLFGPGLRGREPSLKSGTFFYFILYTKQQDFLIIKHGRHIYLRNLRGTQKYVGFFFLLLECAFWQDNSDQMATLRKGLERVKTDYFKALNREFRYKRQLARAGCHSLGDRKLIYRR